MSAPSIQDQAIARYQKNLAYLQLKQPQVYQKVTILENAIAQSQYPQKYELEYKEEGYFDVREIESGSYLYGQNSKELAKKAARSVDFSKTNSVIETFYNYDITESAANKADNELDVRDSLFATVAPVIQYIRANIPKETQMKKIHKFLFFGTGLGVHIESIDQKIAAQIYFIVEENLELFRLSLFVTDYAAIAERADIYFSIMENRTDFMQTFNHFYHDGFIRNQYLKFYAFSPAYDIKIREIQNAVVTQSHLTYPHHRLLEKSLKVIDALGKGYQFLNISRHFEDRFFADKPLLYIAAGPSLSKHIEWVKENHNRFIIWAPLVIVPYLLEQGIEPDLVIQIDERAEPIKKILAKIDFDRYLQEALFICSPSVPLELLTEVIEQKQIFLVEDRTKYKIGYGNISAMSVGEAGYMLSLITDAREIYLLGLDLALDYETGSTHSEGHISKQALKTEAADKGKENVLSLDKSTLKIQGNFREWVYTTPLFDGSIHILNNHTRTLKKPYQKIYNLSDGAMFEMIQPLRADTVDTKRYPILDKHTIRKAMHKTLQAYASGHIRKEEKEYFCIRYHDALAKQEAIAQFTNTKIVTLDKFQEHFLQMANVLMQPPHPECGELAQIYNIYLHYVGGYIGEFTNTRELNNPKRHIKKFQSILSKQFGKFTEVYIEALQKYQLCEEEAVHVAATAS